MGQTFYCCFSFLWVFSFLGKLIDVVIKNLQFEVSDQDRVVGKAGNYIKLEVSIFHVVGVTNLGKTMFLDLFQVKLRVLERFQVEFNKRLKLFGGDFGVDDVLYQTFVDFLVVKRVFVATFDLLGRFSLVFQPTFGEKVAAKDAF